MPLYTTKLTSEYHAWLKGVAELHGMSMKAFLLLCVDHAVEAMVEEGMPVIQRPALIRNNP